MTAAHEVLPKPSLLSMLSSGGGGAGLQRRVSQLFFLVVLTGITIATVCSQSLVQADPHRFATVPALAVSGVPLTTTVPVPFVPLNVPVWLAGIAWPPFTFSAKTTKSWVQLGA